MIEYEQMIALSESIEKEEIYNKYLKKFCLNSEF